MKELTLAAKDALLTGRLQDLAAILHEHSWNTNAQQTT